MPDSDRRLPIKVVITDSKDHTSPKARGSKRKIFDKGDLNLRRNLISQIGEVRTHFYKALAKDPDLPAVARVILKKNALAKSHRPKNLFADNTCPIIGGENFGSLLVSISLSGLGQLEKQLAASSHIIQADISTVQRIEPFTANDAASPEGVRNLTQTVDRTKLKNLKLKLFEHKELAKNDAIKCALSDLTNSLKLPPPELLPYVANLRIFRVNNIQPGAVAPLANFVGTQSIGIFPQFKFSLNIYPEAWLRKNLPVPAEGKEYPIVGLIDTGTDPNNRLLNSWIVERDEEDVPRADQDNNHGSFVAGLIIGGKLLNHNDPRFPVSQAKIVDVVAIPKNGGADEQDLLMTICRVVKKYPYIRIWNLSFSRVDKVCEDQLFSDFGVELDAIQHKYDVTFVNCAGNYVENPLRSWPPEDLGRRTDYLHQGIMCLELQWDR